jgi:hypothetical protein
MAKETLQIGVGWIKESKDGKQMISMVGGDKRHGSTLILKTSDGVEHDITNFMIFFNDLDESNPKHQKAPHVKAVVFQD